MPLNKILIIQTAFLGDVVLATGLVEKLHTYFPNAEIHFLLRKGNEGVLKGHPILKKIWILDKSRKLSSMAEIIKGIRTEQFDLTINLQRFLTSGILAVLSGGKRTVGFAKNPLSWAFSKSYPHQITADGTVHEIARNQQLIASITDTEPNRPVLYPSEKDFDAIKLYQQSPFITIAPASVWFTKQWPKEKWIGFVTAIPKKYTVYLLGAPSDSTLCEEICKTSSSDQLVNLAGKLSPLASAALMKSAVMNFVNDSAPLHFASGVNAPVRALFCSTVKGFGFGPLSDDSAVIEVGDTLPCRPCGLHGHKACPKGHFKCAYDIDIQQLIAALPNE